MTRFIHTVAAGAVLAIIGVAPIALADEGPSHAEHAAASGRTVACTCPAQRSRTEDRNGATASALVKAPSTANTAPTRAAPTEGDTAVLQQIWTAP